MIYHAPFVYCQQKTIKKGASHCKKTRSVWSGPKSALAMSDDIVEAIVGPTHTFNEES